MRNHLVREQMGSAWEPTRNKQGAKLRRTVTERSAHRDCALLGLPHARTHCLHQAQLLRSGCRDRLVRQVQLEILSNCPRRILTWPRRPRSPEFAPSFLLQL